MISIRSIITLQGTLSVRSAPPMNRPKLLFKPSNNKVRMKTSKASSMTTKKRRRRTKALTRTTMNSWTQTFLIILMKRWTAPKTQATTKSSKEATIWTRWLTSRSIITIKICSSNSIKTICQVIKVTITLTTLSWTLKTFSSQWHQLWLFIIPPSLTMHPSSKS